MRSFKAFGEQVKAFPSGMVSWCEPHLITSFLQGCAGLHPENQPLHATGEQEPPQVN